jgi:hypothetical protein
MKWVISNILHVRKRTGRAPETVRKPEWPRTSEGFIQRLKEDRISDWDDDDPRRETRFASGSPDFERKTVPGPNGVKAMQLV